MRRTITVLGMLVACTGSDEEAKRDQLPKESVRTHRYTNQQDGYATDAPDEWSVSEDRGSTIFTAPNGKKHTIVVRAAARPRQLVEGRNTTTDDITAATERVLRTLPNATIVRRWSFSDAAMPAQAFAVEFSPPGLDRRYQRVHVVALGAQRLFHLSYTAPAGDQISEAALEHMVIGLQEEG